MSTTACILADCGRPILIRGLCRHHYRKALDEGTVDEVGLPKRRPAVERYGSQPVDLWESGMLVEHIAQELGTTGPTIRAVLKQKGVENPGRISPRSRLRHQLRTNESIEGLRRLDDLPVEVAIREAWIALDLDPELRGTAQQQVRDVMPHLARALDRLAMR